MTGEGEARAGAVWTLAREGEVLELELGDEC